MGSGADAKYFCSDKCRNEYLGKNAKLIPLSHRDDIVEVGRRCGRAATSRRTTATSASGLGPDRLLMTPASVSKGFMTPEMMVVTDLDGEVVEAAPAASHRPRR
jgi:ribulose-5-phosphate 4-epimerase/fuculose-1-phosphate aldolase